jgi:hypothetical protein
MISDYSGCYPPTLGRTFIAYTERPLRRITSWILVSRDRRRYLEYCYMIEILNSTAIWPLVYVSGLRKGGPGIVDGSQPDRAIGQYQPVMGEKVIGRSLR